MAEWPFSNISTGECDTTYVVAHRSAVKWALLPALVSVWLEMQPFVGPELCMEWNDCTDMGGDVRAVTAPTPPLVNYFPSLKVQVVELLLLEPLDTQRK